MEAFWLTLGFIGEFFIVGRFVIQWIVSEKAKKSIVPFSFWIWSLCGGVILLSYAIYRRDPVFIVAHSMGSFVYLRNITLIRQNAEARKKNEE